MSKLLFFLLGILMTLGVTAQGDTTLNEYKGTYKFPEGSATPSVEISIQGGALYASATIGTASLARMGKDTFSIPEHGGMVYFFRNDQNKVHRIRVVVGDLDLEGTKEGAGASAWIRREEAWRRTSR
jgi:hypothetical protein